MWDVLTSLFLAAMAVVCLGLCIAWICHILGIAHEVGDWIRVNLLWRNRA